MVTKSAEIEQCEECMVAVMNNQLCSKCETEHGEIKTKRYYTQHLEAVAHDETVCITCDQCEKAQYDDIWHLGCFEPPNNGKWISEIISCPKSVCLSNVVQYERTCESCLWHKEILPIENEKTCTNIESNLFSQDTADNDVCDWHEIK